MTTRLRTRPAAALARRSIIAQRSSRPGPPSPPRVSLRVAPKKNTPASTAMTTNANAPSGTEPPIANATNMIAPSARLNSGIHQRELVIDFDMEDLLYGSLEESGQRQRERERRRVALLLDGVDRLARHPH